ncbi:UDP-N-acetylmuramoyl-tripeptide--D-alanyl-D-alanine ligase [Vibrio profundum]|uniref:UDP-N-acetylmuramoyl-tripeptide--D-alanyl-D- alanine ligase n=1 Tax=Vibrio profundum TaxID=2910247 RepID=UPI003D14A9DB
MIAVSLSQLSNVLDAKLIGEDLNIDSVSTDSRHIDGQGLFIALVGDRFDGHQFAQQAITQGAVALLVSTPLDVSVPQLVVSDSKWALGQIGAWVHRQCQAKTAAITGSCGKTTVKEMLSSILSRKGQLLATLGNFNNDIGVPLTLLRETKGDEFAVLELGANHIGEIAYTTKLVQPDVALVNNVAAAHLEGFGSLDGVKQAKGEIYQGLQPGADAIVNLDSHGGASWDAVLQDKVVRTFSMKDNQADFFASAIELTSAGEAQFLLHTPEGQCPIQLGLVGEHNVGNALAASALAFSLGASLVDVQQGLAELSGVKGRVERIILRHNIDLIDDSYNASVPAMEAAVDLLHRLEGKKWLILGNMAELGEQSATLHRQVGERAAQYDFEHVLTYGYDAAVISALCQGEHFSTHSDLLAYIEQHLPLDPPHKHTLLVKGANSAGMFQIAASLQEIYS